MAKTNRRTKPATDARLASPAAERTLTQPQPLSRKSKSQRPPKGNPAQQAGSASTSTAIAGQSHTLPRPGSKQALLLSLLSRQQGASLAEMMKATGWLPHSTRAALTGLRQRGCTIERSSNVDGSSTYRIPNATPAVADGEKA